MSHAFTLATHDPNTAEKGVIAGREVYARKFSLKDVQWVLKQVETATKSATEENPFTVRDELKPIVKVLNARIADGGKGFTVDDLLELTEEEYRKLLLHYAPALLGSVGVGGEGKA